MTMRHAPLAALLCAALVAGCGIAGKAIAPVAGMVTGGGARPSAVQMPKTGPEITVTLTFRGIKFPMRVLEKEGNLTTWVASDGAQMTTRDGIVISTRGFGDDLMSAQVPTVAELTGGAATHKRVDFYLDGTDTMLRRDYDCTVSAGDGGKGPAGTRHLVEKCQTDIGYITNQYWIGNGGRIVQSAQWVSRGAGYASFVAP